MKSLSIRHYIKKLICDGHKWQYCGINGNGVKPKYFFSSVQLLISCIAIIGAIFLKNGFNKDFIGYIIASLSIFIGLFLTLILTVFDKFQRIDFNKPHLTEQEEVSLIQTKNFFIQFTALTSYSILIALFCIVLLSASLLFNYFNQDITQYELAIKNINFIKILNFSIVLSVFLYRIIIIYFLFDFLIIVVYALTSIYDFITLEIEKVKVRK